MQGGAEGVQGGAGRCREVQGGAVVCREVQGGAGRCWEEGVGGRLGLDVIVPAIHPYISISQPGETIKDHKWGQLPQVMLTN